MTIALVGGNDFDPAVIVEYLKAHPGDVIVSGSSPSERYAAEKAEALGLEVQVPILRDDLYGKGARDCQVVDVLLGADEIVILGKASSGRAHLAVEIHKRVDSWRKDGRKLVYLVPEAVKVSKRSTKASRPEWA